jgi:hypothetical protein
MPSAERFDLEVEPNDRILRRAQRRFAENPDRDVDECERPELSAR